MKNLSVTEMALRAAYHMVDHGQPNFVARELNRLGYTIVGVEALAKALASDAGREWDTESAAARTSWRAKAQGLLTLAEQFHVR